MKKLFHRKNKSTPSSPEQTPPRTRPAGEVNGDPSLRTSRYESTSSAGLPQTGQYPLKGNNSAVNLKGRRSDTYSRGQATGAVEPSPPPSSSNPYYGSLPAPRVTSASYDHQPSANPLPNRPSESDLAARSQRRRSARYSNPPTEDFSNLNLGSTQAQLDYDDYPLRQQHNGQTAYSPHAQGRGYPATSHERPSHDATHGQSDYNNYPLRQQQQQQQHHGQTTFTPDTQSLRYPTTSHERPPQDANHGQPGYDDYSLPQQHNGQTTFSPHAQSRGYPTTGPERPSYEEGNRSRFPHDDRVEPVHMGSDMNPQPRNDGQREYGSQDNYDTDSHVGHAGDSSGRAYGNPPENTSTPTASRSIRRKEIQPQHTPATNQVAFHPSSNTGARSPARDPHSNEYAGARQEEAFQPRPHVPKDLHSVGAQGRLTAREVVDRARENTYDTEVVEKVAPAVVHETVHDNVLHIREEQITKEIHTHDVFHRILPIIDVEVLPPRHFLPVEGGGLVEISGKEVPGRGNNWVVAETASKIPSDQPAPRALRPFSARQFVGSEGDAVRYQMPEGHERTERTWVHPPELETGGRNTGQTWPMEFGSETAAKSSRSKSSKTKHSRKPVGPQSSTMQQQRTRDRM
ncbi:MAG: hypothetical protein Q9168_006669 [Polycauliona sp. 1 TL-2023]